MSPAKMIVRMARSMGFSVERTARNHLRFKKPGSPIIVTGYRGEPNIVSIARRELERAARQAKSKQS